jgi:ribosomal protein L19E
MPTGRWGTVSEAATHYGITRQRVHKLIGKGSFSGARLVRMPGGAAWLLPFPFVRRQLRNGRPPKAVEKERQ